MRTLPYWRRVAAHRWVCPTTPLALVYCSVNCHYLLYSGGRPVCQVLSFEEADEALHDLLDPDVWEAGL